MPLPRSARDVAHAEWNATDEITSKSVYSDAQFIPKKRRNSSRRNLPYRRHVLPHKKNEDAYLSSMSKADFARLRYTGQYPPKCLSGGAGDGTANTSDCDSDSSIDEVELERVTDEVIKHQDLIKNLAENAASLKVRMSGIMLALLLLFFGKIAQAYCVETPGKCVPLMASIKSTAVMCVTEFYRIEFFVMETEFHLLRLIASPIVSDDFLGFREGVTGNGTTQ